MTRRSLVIGLHWATALLILVLLNDGVGTGWHLAFMAVGGVWLAIMVFGGPLGGPGPKLQGWARAMFRPLHLAMYGLLAGAVALTAAVPFGYATAAAARTALIILLCLALFHAIFHLWRHTTLHDGALRMMTPRIWHKYL